MLGGIEIGGWYKFTANVYGCVFEVHFVFKNDPWLYIERSNCQNEVQFCKHMCEKAVATELALL